MARLSALLGPALMAAAPALAQEAPYRMYGWHGGWGMMLFGPLFALLVDATETKAGFWWDFAVALGFAGAAMMGVQFMLTARFKRAAAPFGSVVATSSLGSSPRM